MPIKLSGTALGKTLRDDLKHEIESLSVVPHIAIVQVGALPASTCYIGQKIKNAEKIGIKVSHIQLEELCTQQELINTVSSLNTRDDIHGYIVQMPLPKHLSFEGLLEFIDPKKDIDGLHPWNQGGLATGVSYFTPCTPQGIVLLLQENNIELEGKHCVIINRSQIVGRPLAQLLLNEHATVTLVHSRTPNIQELTQQADILITATGNTSLLTADHVREGVVLIDVGCSYVDEKPTGDILDQELIEKSSAYSPVPGGVGPMTVTCLLRNAVQAAS